MIALCVWTGGVLPSWYRDRIGRAAACVGRKGGGGKRGTLYLLWHSGYPWALQRLKGGTIRAKNQTDHRREWREVQQLAAEKQFTAIDIEPIVGGARSGIDELGITVEGQERKNLRAMLRNRQYSACKDLLSVAALAGKPTDDALCVFDVDFVFNADVAMADFLDERPRLRCNVATMPDGSASMGIQFILLPACVPNPWQQSYPTGLTMAEHVPVMGDGSYADILESTMLDSLRANGFRGAALSPLARLHVKIGRFKRTATDIVCIGTPLAEMIASYRYRTDLSQDTEAASEVEREDGLMLRQGQACDEAWARDIVARYPPFAVQIEQLGEAQCSDARRSIIDDLDQLYVAEGIDIPAMVRARYGLHVPTDGAGIASGLGAAVAALHGPSMPACSDATGLARPAPAAVQAS